MVRTDATQLAATEGVREIGIKKIKMDGGTQSRVVLHEPTIADYAEEMKKGTEFPPIIVFYDRRTYWLADGFHRVLAARKARRKKVMAEIRHGSRRDSILHSVGANATHGLRRTNADKRAAVVMLLTDPEWARWSDRQIARQCRVSQPFVGKVRAERSENVFRCDSASDTRKAIRGGKEYAVDVGEIGASNRRRKEWDPPADAVFSSIVGDNDTLIREVAKLYLRPGFSIADATYGKGVFWRKVDVREYDFFPSDAVTCARADYDFRHLPHDDGTMDVVVLDPPYCHNPGDMIVEANYQNSSTTKGLYHDDILALYREGMEEARRVLKDDGLLWVKCKDEVESGKQRWSHIELHGIAEKIGFHGKDLFVLTQRVDPIVQHESQSHARKNHSYLWIFARNRRRRRRKRKARR